MDIKDTHCMVRILKRVIGMKKIIIYGAGAYGKIFFYEAERYGVIDIEAFTVDTAYMRNEKECGLPVVPFEQVEHIYPPNQYDMLVLCGYTVMRNRKRMYERAKEKGYHLINYISPHAMLETEIEMGDNNIIMSNSVIGFDGVMGNGNIIWPNVYFGHGFVMENHSIISAGCTLGGNSHIENLVFLGMGVTARGYIRYGTESLVGIGSNVVKHVEPYSTCYGNPAKVIGYHKDTGVVVRELVRNCL